MENKREILKVVDLQKKFHKLEVLKGISTTFHENEVVSIIGPSGGGKSTFLRCLNLLEHKAVCRIIGILHIITNLIIFICIKLRRSYKSICTDKQFKCNNKDN